MNYGAIDPGLQGALAILDNGGVPKLLEPMPTSIKFRDGGRIKNWVSVRQLANDLKTYTNSCDMIALEYVNSMPKQGVASMFSLGDSFACARSAIAITGRQTIFVMPNEWKKHFGINKGDKELARCLAIDLYPDYVEFFHKNKELGLTKEQSLGICDAILMARWLYETRRIA